MHVPPASRRWGTRLGLALVVAIVIGYVPGQVMRRDPRTVKLRLQLDDLDGEVRTLTAANAALVRDIAALTTQISAVEDRARADLGMVYSEEIVIRIAPAVVAPEPTSARARAKGNR